MSAREVAVVNKLGLHARAASRMVAVARCFDAAITVACDGRSADGKSIVSLLTLAASCGKPLSVHADGRDAEAALAAVCELVESGFGEGTAEA